MSIITGVSKEVTAAPAVQVQKPKAAFTETAKRVPLPARILDATVPDSARDYAGIGFSDFTCENLTGFFKALCCQCLPSSSQSSSLSVPSKAPAEQIIN